MKHKKIAAIAIVGAALSSSCLDHAIAQTTAPSCPNWISINLTLTAQNSCSTNSSLNTIIGPLLYPAGYYVNPFNANPPHFPIPGTLSTSVNGYTVLWVFDSSGGVTGAETLPGSCVWAVSGTWSCSQYLAPGPYVTITFPQNQMDAYGEIVTRPSNTSNSINAAEGPSCQAIPVTATCTNPTIRETLPVPGCQVSIPVEADGTYGGHSGTHTGPRPAGYLVDPTTAIDPLNCPGRGTGSWTGSTDNPYVAIGDLNGVANLLYIAPEVSGQTFIVRATATYNGGFPGTQPQPVGFLITEPNLTQLTPIPQTALTGGTVYNPGMNHAGTSVTLSHLNSLALAWNNYWISFNATYPPNFVGPILPVLPLAVNDLSLPLGGLFDTKGNWSPPHHLHRMGNSADVGSGANNGFNLTTDIPVYLRTQFMHFAKAEGFHFVKEQDNGCGSPQLATCNHIHLQR